MAKRAVKQKKPASGKEISRRENTELERTGGKIPYLETSIDKFYRLVKERKSINFYEAAAEYGVDKEQIASWARILEEHKLARVHYPVFGSPVILIETEKPGRHKEAEEEKVRGKMTPKIIVALAGGLMLFFGYVMVISNAFTIGVRSQFTMIIERFRAPFTFLPYPLNIIAPIAIIIAVVWFVLRLRRRRKPLKGKPVKEEKKSPPKEKDEKKSKGIEDKLSKIKKELGS